MSRGRRGLPGDDEVLGKAYDARMIRRLWRYVRPYRGLVSLSLALLLLAAVVQLVQPYLVKLAIDGAILADRAERLLPLGLLFLVAVLGEFLLRYGQFYVLERAGQNVVLDLRHEVFAHLQRLDAAFFDRNPVGRLMTRVTTDVEALNEAFTSGLVLILADTVKLLGIVAVLLWLDWRLALVTFAVLPPMAGLSWVFRRRIRAAYREVRTRVARLNAFLQEAVSGIRVLQLFRCEDRAREEFRRINRGHRHAEMEAVAYDSAFSAVVELMGALTLAAIVWAGGWRIGASAISFGTLVAFIAYAERFFRPLEELSQRYAVMQGAMASSERIFQLLDTAPAVISPSSPRPLPRRPRGEIVFEDVTFGYGNGEPVLRDISFQVRPGERVGVVGWTGSGKSTLLKLLIRLYDVRRGRITLDGIDVRELDLHELRRSVGVVLQDHFLFAGSVEANISLGDPRVDGARVRRAAEAAGAYRFIQRLPRGYDEMVRERGSNLSVGEKQLLSFARAIAFDPSVLVLDEATSSVDPATEARVQRGLEAILGGRTSLIVAHRLATLQGADRILVLHRGRLREEGSHRDLVRLPGGLYRALWELQAPGAA